jgi:Lrp/AsnC family transcriptional regulator for asnA, asnC and gidA
MGGWHKCIGAFSAVGETSIIERWRMDELDQKLLNVLQRADLQKIRALAPILGVGERTVYRRICAMRSKGIIKIIAIPDFVLFGYRAWAKIGIKVEPRALTYVANQLAHNPSIYFVACSYGNFDIITAVHFLNIEILTEFINSELVKINGILSTETMVLTSPRKYYNFCWEPLAFKKAKNGCHRYLDESPSYPNLTLDQVDRNILSFLMEDGFTRPATIKSKLGISESTVRKRMKRMKNNGIFKIVAVPNPELLEDEVWATMGITINKRPAHAVLNAIVKHPEVYLASSSIGRFNLVIAVRFGNIDFLNHFVTIDLPAIDGVSDVETFLHNRPLKYHNIHWPISNGK